MNRRRLVTGETYTRFLLTTYNYDYLNRLHSKTYSDGTPPVSYTYDPAVTNGVGHLGSVSNSSSTTNYLTFDQLGRVTSSNQMNGAKTYPFYYGYNFASDLISEQYPSGRVVSFTYDNANRLNGASGQMGTQASAYASSFVYAAFGQPTNYQYGNGVVRVLNYNSRLQIQSYTDQGYNSTTNTTTPLLSATLNWYDANNHNNGNLQGVTYTHSGSGFSTPTTFSDTFTYDNVNRLLSATDVLVATSATEWLQNYGYDPYGNMSVLSSTGITPPANTPGPYTLFSNNQIVGGSYDLAGNQTFVNGNTLTYDAEGREVTNISNGTETYAYDGNGKRVGKSSQTGSTTFVYDALGQLAMEVSSVAAVPACATCYLTDDHLGSTRLVTDGSGNVVARHDYLPFGYEIQASDNVGRGIQFGGYDNVNQKFTGKERDAESGLDYFGARYYGSALGRFTSPDSPFADQHTSNPQSWNLYAYGRNNPLRFTDDDGEKVKEATHVVYYDVHGSTAAEAQQNAKQTSGLGEGSDPMMGLTTTRTSIDMSSLKISETNDGFEGVAVTDTMTVTAGDVKLDVTTTLPRWVEQGQARPEEGAAWDKSQQSLQAHEDGHKAIAEQGAAALDKSLPGTKGVGIAPTSGDAAAAASKKLSGALTAKVKANGAQTHQNQIDYDARTDHGRKQTQ